MTVTAVAVMATACWPAQPGSPTVTASPSHSQAATVGCTHLKARAPSIEACPPADLALDSPAISHGAGIAEADSRHAAEGFARSYAQEVWAVNQGYVNFLRAGLISSTDRQATAISFGQDLGYMVQAARAGTKYRIATPLKITLVRMVAVPATVSAVAPTRGIVAGPNALIVGLRGPYAAYVGSNQVQSNSVGFGVRVAVFGQLRDDPDLGGWVWVWGGYVTCDESWVGGLCSE